MYGVWPRLLDPRNAELVRQAGEAHASSSVSGIASLRKRWPEDLVRAALEWIAARRKAAEKFPDADRIVADVEGVEQATSLDVARHKARRFAALGADGVLDLCCGIGGDAMALAEMGRVWMFDRNPVRAWMARQNVDAPAAVADVTTLKVAGRPFHIDPSRRSRGRRVWRYEDYEPGPAFLSELARGDGAIKLSPGVDFDPLPPGEVEIISRDGALVQAVLWTGRLARHERTATLIRPTSIDSLHGAPGRPIPVSEPMRFLLAIDPAVERAGLIGELSARLNLPAIHPALGLLTSDSLTDNLWLTPFELVDQMPWRPKKVKQWLEAHGGGIVEVKTRGGAIDPDKAQRDLHREGDQPFTVFVLRFGKSVVAMVTRRVH